MDEGVLLILGILLIIAIFFITLTFLIMNDDIKTTCFETNKTYLKYEENFGIGFEYCGDFRDIKSLIEQIEAEKYYLPTA